MIAVPLKPSNRWAEAVEAGNFSRLIAGGIILDFWFLLFFAPFLLLGLGWVSSSLDRIANEMRRSNDLKEAEQRRLHAAEADSAANKAD
ncbi:TPA: hypothetical protein ACQQMC_006030 [Pseudomonas aeruginosa]